MSVTSRAYAALILPDTMDLDTGLYKPCVYDAIAANDIADDGTPLVSDARGIIAGDTFCIQMIAQEDSDYGPRLMFVAFAHALAGKDAQERMHRLLADIVRRALPMCDADFVEWLDTDCLMERDEFLEAGSYVSQRRAITSQECRNKQTLQAMHDMQEQDGAEITLARTFRDAPIEPEPLTPMEKLRERAHQTRLKLSEQTEEGANARLGMASWALAGVTATLCLPVAAFLGVMGVLRGMDFRLAAQAMTVTGVFVALENHEMVSKVFRHAMALIG